MIINTRLIGDPVLQKRADEVKEPAHREVRKLIEDLTDTMRDAGLVGLAAPQIGVSLRVFVVEIRPDNPRGAKAHPLQVFINPTLELSKKTVLGYEGCGSIPNLFGEVERSEHLLVTYQDLESVRMKGQYNGLVARIIQHETDHLNGIMFTERADPRSLMWKHHFQHRVLGIETT